MSSASICVSVLLFASTVLAPIYNKIKAKYGKPLCLKRKPFSINNNEENFNLLQEELYNGEAREGSPPHIVLNREPLIYDHATAL